MEKVKKLSMCRICLVENVRMSVVTDKSLQQMYEKLADVPFVTEDRRPILACSFCCTKLKQCCQLHRKCLEAEELLTRMLSEEYKQKPMANKDHIELVGGFIISPVEHINIVEECETECTAMTQKVAVVCEQQFDVELKMEHPSAELDPIHVDMSHPAVEDTPALQSTLETKVEDLVMVIKIEPEDEQECSEQEHRLSEMEKIKLENPDESYEAVEDIPAQHSVSVTKDVPLVEIKIEPEEFLEMSKKTPRARVTKKIKLENPDESYEAVEDIPAQHSESVTKDVHLVEIKIEPEEFLEMSKKTPRAKVTERATVTKIEDNSPGGQMLKELLLSNSSGTQTTKPSTSESVAEFKESITTTSQSSLVVSSHYQTGVKLFKCDICARSFSEERNLKIHIRVHSGEKPYKCEVCQLCFSYKSTLEIHFRKHSGEKPHKCEICKRSFRYNKNLNKHYRKHTGENLFKCDICESGFRDKRDLNKHIRIHSGEKVFKCEVCQHSFSNKSALETHFRKHSGEKPFKCEVCQRSFRQFSHLKTHSLVHTGEKHYKCEICQDSFRHNKDLKIHYTKHTGESLFKCDICERGFNDKRHLIRHVLGHSGEKPYKCEICQRSYGYSNHLKRHSRVHIGENSYKCEICQRIFSSHSKLEVHFRSHTGEKPYTCQICQRSFVRSNDLTRHKNRTHTDKPVKCA